MNQNDKQVATAGTLAIEAITIPPFAVCQMERIFADFPGFM